MHRRKVYKIQGQKVYSQLDIWKNACMHRLSQIFLNTCSTKWQFHGQTLCGAPAVFVSSVREWKSWILETANPANTPSYRVQAHPQTFLRLRDVMKCSVRHGMLTWHEILEYQWMNFFCAISSILSWMCLCRYPMGGPRLMVLRWSCSITLRKRAAIPLRRIRTLLWSLTWTPSVRTSFDSMMSPTGNMKFSSMYFHRTIGIRLYISGWILMSLLTYTMRYGCTQRTTMWAV